MLKTYRFTEEQREELYAAEKKNKDKNVHYSQLKQNDEKAAQNKSFAGAFSKACGFQRQSLWSLSADSETPCL